jgi:chemotaxis family two-component system response regulator Rcp1
LGFSSVFTAALNIQGPASDWPSVSELLPGTMGGSGSNPNPDADQSSVSSSPLEEPRVRGHVLIVEDNEADVFLIQAAIVAKKLPMTLQVVRDGEQATRYFDAADRDVSAPCPSLVILDINLPKKQGGEVLKHMRRSRRCANALVIAVSTSDSARDREQMKELGVNGYFPKPSEYAAFMNLGDIVKELLAGRTSENRE